MHYHWKGDALAKLLILGLIIVIFINSGISIGFQLLTSYSHKTSADALTSYSDYNIIDRSVTAELSAYLLAAPAKENRLILMEKHFLLNRHRVLLDSEVARDFQASVKGDIGTVSVRLEGNSRIAGLSFHASTLPIRIGSLYLRVPLLFLLWNLLLFALEMLVWYLIHKIRNG